MIFIIIMWLSSSPMTAREEMAEMSPTGARFAAAAGFDAVTETVTGRCSMCHTAEPAWPGVHRAPKGVILDNEVDIAAHAREIYLQSGRSHAMPPANVTEMAPAERKAIIDWYQGAVAG